MPLTGSVDVHSTSEISHENMLASDSRANFWLFMPTTLVPSYPMPCRGDPQQLGSVEGSKPRQPRLGPT